MSPHDIPPSRDGSDIYLLINHDYVLSAKPFDGFPPGHISFSDAQRTWAGIALTDQVQVELYDPFKHGGQAYLGAMDVEVGFAGKKSTETPYDQDDLAQAMIKVCFYCPSIGIELGLNLSMLTWTDRLLRIRYLRLDSSY